MSIQIEGVPEGWELLRLGTPLRGEIYLDDVGHAVVNELDDHAKVCWPIIRRIAPVCTWQHGVFADGWIAEDGDGTVWLYSVEPHVAISGWCIQGKVGIVERLKEELFCNPPKFRDDLPWTERIQQVGPTIEAQLRGES